MVGLALHKSHLDLSWGEGSLASSALDKQAQTVESSSCNELCVWHARHWTSSWGWRGPFPTKLRLKATKHANHDITSYVSHPNIISAYIPIKTSGTGSLYLYINPLPNYLIPSQFIGGTYVRVGSLCKENNKGNYSHRVNLSRIDGGWGINVNAKGKVLIFL